MSKLMGFRKNWIIFNTASVNQIRQFLYSVFNLNELHDLCRPYYRTSATYQQGESPCRRMP